MDSWDELSPLHTVREDEDELLAILDELAGARVPRALTAREVFAGLAPRRQAAPVLSLAQRVQVHRRAYTLIAPLVPRTHPAGGLVVLCQGFVPGVVLLAAELWGHVPTCALAARLCATLEVRVASWAELEGARA